MVGLKALAWRRQQAEPRQRQGMWVTSVVLRLPGLAQPCNPEATKDPTIVGTCEGLLTKWMNVFWGKVGVEEMGWGG